MWLFYLHFSHSVFPRNMACVPCGCLILTIWYTGSDVVTVSPRMHLQENKSTRAYDMWDDEYADVLSVWQAAQGTYSIDCTMRSSAWTQRNGLVGCNVTMGTYYLLLNASFIDVGCPNENLVMYRDVTNAPRQLRTPRQRHAGRTWIATLPCDVNINDIP